MHSAGTAATVTDDRSKGAELRDLEAETRHRINMLVARTKAWRNGSIQVLEPDSGIEAAAS